MPTINVDTLNCIYFALFFVGLGYAIFIAITGGLSHIDMPDVHIDVPHVDLPGDVDIPGANVDIGGPDLPVHGIDAPDVHVSPLSPITIASFVTTFGGIGVLSTQFFAVDPRLSLVFATVGGLVVSGIMFLFYSQVLIRSQGSSEVLRSELIGLEAEVTVPIGESSPGQVTYETKAGRMSSMARSVDGRAIPRGQFVRIVRFIGSMVLVQPLSTGSERKE
jgi:membrane protein implicated in regulation of membrane protease activity